MQHYSELLQKAVGTIVDKKEESDLESLFSFGETTALVDDIKGLDDFELICFLVIKSPLPSPQEGTLNSSSVESTPRGGE